MLTGNALIVLAGYYVGGVAIQLSVHARRDAEAILVRHGLLDLVEGDLEPTEGTMNAPGLVVKLSDKGRAHVEGLRDAPLPELQWISPVG